MDREAFLDNLASKLNRPRVTTEPTREIRGVPEFYIERPMEHGADDLSTWPSTFKAELESIGGVVFLAANMDEVNTHLRGIMEELNPDSIITWSRDSFAGWDIDWLWDTHGAMEWTSNALAGDVDAARSIARMAKVGVTTVDFSIANTGTLMFTTNAERNRSVSLLPAMHLALVRQSQIVARMGTALESIKSICGADMPSSMHFVSGPSRSADIENDLSIGVHGPAAVSVIVCLGI